MRPTEAKDLLLKLPKPMGVWFLVQDRWAIDALYIAEDVSLFHVCDPVEGNLINPDDAALKAIREAMAMSSGISDLEALAGCLTGEPYKCDNCDMIGAHDKLAAAHDVSQRIEAGGEFTDVECPVCGALCYPLAPKDEVPDDSTYEVQKTLVLSCKHLDPKTEEQFEEWAHATWSGVVIPGAIKLRDMDPGWELRNVLTGVQHEFNGMVRDLEKRNMIDLVQAVHLAKRLDCCHLLFDRDGPVYKNMVVWEEEER